MLLWLSKLLGGNWHLLNVFSYITLRTIGAALTSLILSLYLGSLFIRCLGKYQIGQTIRDDGPATHLDKAGTPTMGGTLILATILVSVLLWGDLTSRYTYLIMSITLGFGLIGFIDDNLKLKFKNSKGLSAKVKYLSQSILALGFISYIYVTANLAVETQLLMPFFKGVSFQLGYWFIPFAYLVIVGSSNAVNLTDGLDGLAILPVVLVGSALGVFAYLMGNVNFSSYLMIPYIPGVGELSIFCGGLFGAGLGFLWFNSYPAEVFMGDVGSLSLGAALGALAILVRQELLLLVMGGIFVAETLSVIIQVASFKTRGKRVFKMAPLHHHFELAGLSEPKVIVRFWIVTVVLVLCGLATLKLR